MILEFGAYLINGTTKDHAVVIQVERRHADGVLMYLIYIKGRGTSMTYKTWEQLEADGWEDYR